jgi:YidC/Oxa1 family membrane protein insertase
VIDDNKGMSHETRTFLAAILCLLVIIGSSYFFKPKLQPPAAGQATNSTASSESNPSAPGSQSTAPAATSNGAASQAPGSQPIGSQITGISSTPAVATPVRAASAQRTVVVESSFYHVELSNAGAVAHSWILRRQIGNGAKFMDYTDESEPPKPLDVVHPEIAKQLGGWPLSIVMEDKKIEAAANSALYEVSTSPASGSSSAPLQAPVEVDFNWSDGHIAVTKKLKFDASYIATVELNVQVDGRTFPASFAWRGGFGDASAYHASAQTQVFYNLNSKLNLLSPSKLGQPDNTGLPNLVGGPLAFVGLEDNFFATAFLPPLAATGVQEGQPDVLGASMTLRDWSMSRDVVDDGKTSKELVPEIAAGSAKGEPLNLRLFVGPKNLDELKLIRPPLNELVQFGWLAIIAEPLFYFLHWVHNYVPNYGWAIVLVTIGLNMVLLPLRIKSTRSMQKMQKVGPEVKAIQDKYKKYSLKDPRKAKMNEEVMAVYNREGINPLGGCLPQLIQMPIWFALYRMLNVTIELRHAPWIGWIHDLSSRDPYFILPILMAVSMYVMQKMTPTPASDPAQQRMLALMPVMFGGMFIIFPVSSGLVLYIFSSNLVNMAQQYFLNRSAPVPAPKGIQKK